MKSDILRESYGHFTRKVFFSFFFCDENFDRIKIDGHHGLKLKALSFPLNMDKLGHIIYQNLWKHQPESNDEVYFYLGGHFRKLPLKPSFK